MFDRIQTALETGITEVSRFFFNACAFWTRPPQKAVDVTVITSILASIAFPNNLTEALAIASLTVHFLRGVHHLASGKPLNDSFINQRLCLMIAFSVMTMFSNDYLFAFFFSNAVVWSVLHYLSSNPAFWSVLREKENITKDISDE